MYKFRYNMGKKNMLCITVSQGNKDYVLTIAINVETTNHVEYVTDYLCCATYYTFMKMTFELVDKLKGCRTE